MKEKLAPQSLDLQWEGSQPSVTATSKDLTPSFDFLRHQVCIWYTHIYEGKALMHINFL